MVQREAGRSVRRRLRFYNLNAIISFGYRVNSLREKNRAFRLVSNMPDLGRMRFFIPIGNGRLGMFLNAKRDILDTPIRRC